MLGKAPLTFAGRALLVAGVSLLGAFGIVGTASAAGPPDFRDRIDDMYEIENFCDTGVTVTAHERTTGNGWDDGTTFRLSFTSRTTYTYGDKSVSDHWAGRVLAVVTEGEDFESPHTEFIVENGLRAYVRAPGGGTVTRDAGNLQHVVTFGPDGSDEDEFPDFESDDVVKDAGDHPGFYEPLWCEAITEQLGIAG